MSEEASLPEKCRLQEDKIKKLKALVIREKKQNSELTGKLRASDEQLKKGKDENEHLINQIQRLSLTVGELQENQINESALNEKILNLETELAKHLKSNNEFVEILAASKADLKIALDDVHSSNVAREELEVNLSVAQKNENELSSSLANNSDTLNNVQAANKELHDALKDIENKLSDNTSQFNTRLTESKAIITEMELKMINFVDTNERLHQLEQEKDEHVLALNKMEKELDAIKQSRDDAVSSLQEVERRILDQDSLHSEKEASINAQIQQLEQIIKDKEAKVMELETLVQESHQSNIVSDLADIPAPECKQLELKINSLTEYISQLEQNIVELRSPTKTEVIHVTSSNSTNEEQTDNNLFYIFCSEFIAVIKGDCCDSFNSKFIENPNTFDSVKPIMEAVQELQSKKSDLLLTNTVLQDGMSCMTLKCTELEQLLQTSEESLISAKTLYNEEKRALEERIKCHENELDTNCQKLKMMEDVVEDNRYIARALETEKDALQVEMTELRTRTEEKEANLIEEAREAKNALENIELQLHAISESREIEVHSLKEERQILKHEMDMLQSEIDRRDTELKDLNNEKDTLASDLEEVSSRLVIIETDQKKSTDCFKITLSEKIQTNYELTETCRQLEEQLNEISLVDKEKIDAIKHETDVYLLENEKLNNSMELMQSKYDSAEKELESLRHLKDEMDTGLILIESLKLKLSSSEDENKRLREDLTHIGSEKASLSEAIEVKERLIVELSSSNCSIDLEQSNELSSLRDKHAASLEELVELKHFVEKCSSDLRESNAESQMLKDKLSQIWETQKCESETVIKSTSEYVSQIQFLKQENNNLFQRLSELDKKYTNSMSEAEEKFNSLYAELLAEKHQHDILIAEKDEVELTSSKTNSHLQRELTDLQEHLTKKEKAAAILQEELDKALKTARQSTVMDLELAEFEKTLSSLRDQLDAKDDKVRLLDNELKRKEGLFATLHNQMKETEHMKSQSEERANKMKQMLVKTKKELSEVQKARTSHKSRESQITAEVETLNSQLENAKIQLAQISADKNKLEGRLIHFKAINDSTAKSREFVITNLREDLEKTKEERNSLRDEFNAYKLKAHKAFKESKPRYSLTVMSPEETQARNERLEAAIEQLKLKLEDSECNLAVAHNEISVYQQNIDRLEERNKKLGLDSQMKERQWQDRFDRVSIDNSAHESVSMETIKQLSTENETLASAFREQIASIKQEQKETISTLRAELSTTESEMLRLQEELWTLREHRNQMLLSPPAQQNPHFVTYKESLMMPVGQTGMAATMLQQERQQGEGMEHPSIDGTDLDSITSISPRLTPVRGLSAVDSTATKWNYLTPIPLDQLLEGGSAPDQVDIIGDKPDPTNEDAASTVSRQSSQTALLDQLRVEVTNKQKRIDQLSELITDSDAMVVHLTEQAKVLKEEIRRHERNNEREERQLTNNTPSSEYLKNVVLKFLRLRPGQERVQLIAVLATLLSLSAEERETLRLIAEGDKDESPEAQGWTNYFSWAGTT